MIPGRILHRLAERTCSAKTLERVVEPAIADLQKEYSDDVNRARRLRVLLAGYAAILKVIAICAFTASPATDEERRVLGRTLAWSVGLIVVIAGLLTLPPLYDRPHANRWYAATTVVPQAMPLAIPIGIAFGLALGLRARPGAGTAKAILLGGLAASALSFSVLAWVMPAGNQAFRTMTLQESRAKGYDGPVALPKGYSEMTFAELRGEIARLSAAGEGGEVRRSIFSFHLRFSLALATLALVSVLLAALTERRGLRALSALVACLAYWLLLYAGEVGSVRGYLTPPVGAWLPNLVLLSSAMLVSLRLRSSVFVSSRLRG